MSADKGKYVVLFTSGNFIFFKHKNDKGIFCPKSILNSSRQVLKDDIYDLCCDNVTAKHRRDHPDMPEAAVLIATKAKFLKTPRVIQAIGTMKKISTDGEYGFIEYQDGKISITAFCTRITVKPSLEKGGMNKFFSTGCRVKFVAKEQPPSGMFNIEWRVITATDMKHDISETNYEKVTPAAAAPVVAAARPPSLLPAAAPPVRPAAMQPVGTPFDATPMAAPSLSTVVMSPPPGVTPSSSSSSVANGVSYAARAAQQLPAIPEPIAQAIYAASAPFNSTTLMIDDNLPLSAPDPLVFALDAREKEKISSYGFAIRDTESPSVDIYDCWKHYKEEEERSLESFEAELSQLSRVATALYGGDSHVCPISFNTRLIGS